MGSILLPLTMVASNGLLFVREGGEAEVTGVSDESGTLVLLIVTLSVSVLISAVNSDQYKIRHDAIYWCSGRVGRLEIYLIDWRGE